MRTVTFRILMIAIIACLCGITASATHSLGGEATYLYLGNNNYKVTFRIYRDCQSGDVNATAQDDPMYISVFTGNGNKYRSDSVRSTFKSVLPISQLSGCFNEAGTFCVNYMEASITLNLPSSNLGYIIVNQRCCLSGSLLNITDPGSMGLTLSCAIPAVDAQNPNPGNSSPTFNTHPLVRGCINSDFILDYSATDINGDSMRYRFAPVFNGGSANNAKPVPVSSAFVPLYFAWHFSAEDPFGPNGTIDLDPATGIAVANCATAGRYLISVACDEYKNGKLISTINRVYALVVANCNKAVNVTIGRDSVTLGAFPGVSIVRCGGARTVDLKNTSTGATSYRWDFGVPNRDDDTSLLPNPSFTYPAAGKYELTLVAYGASCNDTLRTEVWLSDDVVDVDFDIAGGPCILDTIALTDKSAVTGSAIKSHTWYFDGSVYSGNPLSLTLGRSGTRSIREIVVTESGCIGFGDRSYIVQQAPISGGNDTIVPVGRLLVLMASGGVSYSWTQNGLLDPTALGNSMVTVTTSYTYVNQKFIVTGEDGTGCHGTDTVVVSVSNRGYVFVPSAFSPNNDGLNDVLKAKFSGYELRSLSVYNSRGSRVFFTEQAQQGWNGEHKNQPAATEVYFWMIVARNEMGGVEVFKGDVMLMR